MHMRRPDNDFLKEVYPKLLKWHRWWPKNRDGDGHGLLQWGSSAAGKQGALWETGWDDTPEYAESEMVGNTLDTDAVDLNSLYAMDCENLAYIADAVGDRATAKELREEHTQMVKRINNRLWNPALGIYCSRKWDSRGGAFLTRITPMNFYPLIAGAANREQAKKVIAAMTDPKRFWGKWILPTVPYDDPLWPQQGYWHGTVWAPVNFLVFQGLRRYASPELQAEYAAKGVELFMRNWNARGWCGENFGSDTGVVNGDKHYTWGALMCLTGLESICAIELDGSVTLNGAQSASLHIENVPIHGRRYTVETGPGWARLKSGNRTLFEAKGDVANKRLS
jgi:glycogen debranching enzyme